MRFAMRALIAALLLTTVTSPVLAAEPGGRGNDLRSALAERVREAREQRAEQREQRTERREQRTEQREARREQVQQRARTDAADDNAAQRAERQQQRRAVLRGSDGNANREVPREQRAERRASREQALEARRQAGADTVAGWRARERQRSGRPVLGASGERIASPIVSTRQAPTRRAGGNSVSRQIGDHLQRSGIGERLADPRVAERWRSDWRRDQRHDWRRWREYNRGLFRTGYYYDPFGFGYQRFGLGWQIRPAYYSNRYWLNDPFQYRLPHVGYPYQWVRYWDDAVLVDTRTGRVLDVIYDFFW
jgi:hypothetical protein